VFLKIKIIENHTKKKTMHNWCKASISGSGDMRFKSVADHISQTLPVTRHRCGPWRAPLSRDTRKGIKQV